MFARVGSWAVALQVRKQWHSASQLGKQRHRTVVLPKVTQPASDGTEVLSIWLSAPLSSHLAVKITL